MTGFTGRRWALAAACVSAAVASAGGVWLVFSTDEPRETVAIGSAATSTPACPHRIPQGQSIAAAQATTKLFVTEVVLRRNPVCGFELSSGELQGRVTRGQWAREDTPVQPFPTRHPPVAYRDASKDPAAPEAVYLISRRVLEFVVSGAGGRREIPMSVGVAAPDAGMGAYNVVLVLSGGSWRVDRWWRVRITSSDS